eukprot:COSAG04_NODE_30157_length_264_cov_0.921212_1_plen_45_part_10
MSELAAPTRASSLPKPLPASVPGTAYKIMKIEGKTFVVTGGASGL